MGDMLSQAEIDALLGGGSSTSAPPEEYTPEPQSASDDDVRSLTDEEKDILGEVGNISMGTSATTLFALLNQRVMITTPRVRLINWSEISRGYDRPCVGIRVDYTEGIEGSNILVLKERDVKIISCLMMGGDGKTGIDEPLNEIDLSAISEAMNQMIGSASTSLSSLVKMRIDIDTPNAFQLDFTDNSFLDNVGFKDDKLATISFRMEIGDLIDSEIMQILPLKFALEMVETMKKEMFGAPTPEPNIIHHADPTLVEQHHSQQQYQQQAPPQQQYQQQAPPQQQYQQQAPPQQQYQQQYPPQYPGYDPQYAQYQYQMPPQPQYQQQAPPQQQYPPQYPGYDPQHAQYQYQMPPQPQYQQQAPPQQHVNAKAAQFQSFDAVNPIQQTENIGIIMDVPLEITVELGRTTKKIKEILEFAPGSIIELNKLAGEPIDILVNGKYVAKGEVLVIDENFGIRITDIINPEHRI